MSQPSHPKSHKKAEHGTKSSYVVGFLLSLVFTAIPYYMVVNKTVAGDALLATILGFALLQMLIQIFFFLHLGRGPKPLYNVVFFVSTVGIILVVVMGSIFIMNNLYHNMAPEQVITKLAEEEGIYQVGGVETGACHGTKANHKVTIQNGTVTPLLTVAQHCDTLTFINEDDSVREITFGSYPEQLIYGGESEVFVYKGYAKSIVLNQTGTYQFYDQLSPASAGSFTVAAE